ncbi:hypothetical protein BC829DRAFT_415616 [Chytridium lagenaria]|nr:hypothetical protein BC829DRAFT_415616 [Chytridium lagenaria]
MNNRFDSLLEEIKGLREDNARLQKRLDAKDAEINRLTRQPTAPPAMDIQHPSSPNPTATDTAKDTEDGEILEALSSTKIAAFKADLTQTVVKELLTVMKKSASPTPRHPTLVLAVRLPRYSRSTSM